MLDCPRRRRRSFCRTIWHRASRSGYIFTISNCTRVSLSGTERVTGYTVTAVPQTVGKTGSRGFCSDESGVIKYDPTGGTNCTQPLEMR